MRRTGKSSPEEAKARRFAEVALPYLDAAYNLARWIVRNPQDAEDMVQDAYLRAFKPLDGFRGEDGRAWLLTIVRNTCYTWLHQQRGQGLDTSFDEEAQSLDGHGSVTALDQSDSNPQAITLREADRRWIHRALERLPLEFREILVLREIEDLSYKEIAAIANIPLGTVMSRLARGRKLLLECVRRMNEES
ncbi:MAG: sigma-70 family RNA polymerase sigma factor [Pyrinomonadaceae bacterium]